MGTDTAGCPVKLNSTVFTAMAGSSVTEPASWGSGPSGAHDVTFNVGVTQHGATGEQIARRVPRPRSACAGWRGSRPCVTRRADVEQRGQARVRTRPSGPRHHDNAWAISALPTVNQCNGSSTSSNTASIVSTGMPRSFSITPSVVVKAASTDGSTSARSVRHAIDPAWVGPGRTTPRRSAAR